LQARPEPTIVEQLTRLHDKAPGLAHKYYTRVEIMEVANKAVNSLILQDLAVLSVILLNAILLNVAALA
jgi:hypothetical protein